MTTSEDNPRASNIREARPWLAHYEPEVPPHLDRHEGCLSELLPAASRRFPGRPAIVFSVAVGGRLHTTSMTYRRLQLLVDRFAASLQRLGVRKGDRVALMLPNCPQFVIAYLATVAVGGIAVPFNPLYSAREVEYQLRDCGAVIAVVLSQFYPVVSQVRPGTTLRRVIVTRIKEHFPPLLWCLFTLTRERKLPSAPLAPGDLSFRSLLRAGTPQPAVMHEDETAVLLYTGGTTGISKGVELSHRNLLVNAEQNRAWARLEDGQEITLAAVPLFHAFGLTCCLNLGVMTGATLVLLPNPTDTHGLVLAIHRHRPSVFPVVPTFLVAITNLPGLERFDLRSVRVCPCAGNPLAPAVQRSFIEKTGVRPVEGYGLTEASPVVMGNPPFGEDRHGTVGLPYPDTLARIVDLETGQRSVGLGEGGDWTVPGELVVRGPQVMKGYWGRPEETAEQIRDGWLHTGDIAQMHRDGYFRIVDRKKDMIIRSGMNIYPAEIEAVLLEHPKILEALVVGIPDETRGELVRAFVVPREGVELQPDELLAFCRENLAKFKVPSAVEIREELPKTAVGKPLRRALRDEAVARAAEQ
ncbi:MAG TPA: long-chain fatty acid--CoA ligase [Thermoanaerobaculaceae bacterium]|nr:long-chain fatty acid--CoA ligase [Thermoanaerobaculaceae bacterium]